MKDRTNEKSEKKKLTPRMILVPFASTWRKFFLLLIWRRLFSDEAKSKTIAFKNPGNLLNTSTRQNSSSTGWLVQRFAHCIYKADGSLKRKMSISRNEMTDAQNRILKSMKKRNHTKIKNLERNTHLAWKSQWACMDSSDSIPCTLDRNYLGKKPDDSKVCVYNTPDVI